MDELDKKLNEYIKKNLKKGHTKEQIRSALLRVGYGTSAIEKGFNSSSREKNLKILLFASLVLIAVLAYIIISSKEPIPIKSTVPEVTLRDKPMLLKSVTLPPEAFQRENITLITSWSTEKRMTKDFGMIFTMFDRDGNEVAKYFFTNNLYPTRFREVGKVYYEKHDFIVAYKQPGTYFYKIGPWDFERNFRVYAMDGAIIGNITIKKNPEIRVCGLTISYIAPGSAAERAGLKIGDVILGVNGEHLDFERATIEPKDNLLKEKVLNLLEYTLNTERGDIKITKLPSEGPTLRWRHKVCPD